MIKKMSDAGPVASRQGYKYQDHVAAGLALDAILDGNLLRIECETADDIVLAWHSVGGEILEYVQVKTTENDRKWAKSEILERDDKRRPTSLIEKSLLCATHANNCLFRIVSKRSISKSLAPLMLPRDERNNSDSLKSLAKSLFKSRKTTSPSGLNLEYWAINTLWVCPGNLDSLVAVNQRTIAMLANEFGANPTHQHIEEIYKDLLDVVEKAASASNAKATSQKIIGKKLLLDWWRNHLANTEAAAKRTAKPYRTTTAGFFVELHDVLESTLARAMTGYDAQYELSRWRTDALADYLADWLPEVMLKASELVEVRVLTLRQKLRQAVREVERHKKAVDIGQLLAEVLLHAVLRHRFQSEPIACKLFYSSTSGSKSFGTAHIIHSDKEDQLWLGRAKLARIKTFKDAVKSIVLSLADVLDPDFLKEERDVILNLREPSHLLPTTLEYKLRAQSPIDELLKVIAIPILLTYDSDVLASGFQSDYREKLIDEVKGHYATLKTELPSSVKGIHVHIFFVPVESVDDLEQRFKNRISGV